MSQNATLPERVQFEEEGTWEQASWSTDPDNDEWIGTGWRVRDYVGTLYFRSKERGEVERWLVNNGYTDTGDGAHYQRVAPLDLPEFGEFLATLGDVPPNGQPF